VIKYTFEIFTFEQLQLHCSQSILEGVDLEVVDLQISISLSLSEGHSEENKFYPD
jgi:hypothetical protein